MNHIKRILFFLGLIGIASCRGKKDTDDFSKSSDNESNQEVITSESEPATSESDAIVGNLELGKSLFEGKGTCNACHQPSTKVIGPSIKEIAIAYKKENAAIVKFLKGEGEPIVDPTQFEVMKTNFSITKQMSEEELKSLELYIYSFK